MGFRTKVVWLALLLTALGLTQTSGVYYETRCWALGKFPYRTGLVEIEDGGSGGKRVTMVCLGNEAGTGDAHPGFAFTVPLRIQVVAGMGCLALIVPPVLVIYALRRHRRHPKTAQPRGAGKGGIPSMFHAGRARPALPDRER